MKFPVLYNKDKKGRLNVWKVWSVDDTVHTEYGKLGGKLQTTSFKVEQKNVGKANETTLEEQAGIEALSMWNAKLLKKYFKTKEEANTTVLLRPMLAERYEDFPDLPSKWPSTYVQPKLDGVRCLAYLEGDSVVLLSRGGKIYDIPHISEELKKYFDNSPQLVLDGEIYIHGETLQYINSLVKKERKGMPYDKFVEYKKPLFYHVFDCIDLDTGCVMAFKERLLMWQNQLSKYEYVVPVPTLEISPEQIEEYMGKFLAHGYEGIILRNSAGHYQLAGRSQDLLKYKKFQDAEFKIIGFEIGKGKYSDAVIWLCETGDGKEFAVNPVGTMKEKSDMLATAKKDIGAMVGKMLTVTFINYTPDGVPFHPVGKGIREEE